MGLTALLTMAVILLMVSDMMPKSDAGNFPLLGTFMLAEILLSAAGTLVAIGIMYAHSMAAFDVPPPDWLFRLTRLADLSKSATAHQLASKTTIADAAQERLLRSESTNDVSAREQVAPAYASDCPNRCRFAVGTVIPTYRAKDNTGAIDLTFTALGIACASVWIPSVWSSVRWPTWRCSTCGTVSRRKHDP